jgi:hypothetical protein
MMADGGSARSGIRCAAHELDALSRTPMSDKGAGAASVEGGRTGEMERMIISILAVSLVAASSQTIPGAVARRRVAVTRG